MTINGNFLSTFKNILSKRGVNPLHEYLEYNSL